MRWANPSGSSAKRALRNVEKWKGELSAHPVRFLLLIQSRVMNAGCEGPRLLPLFWLWSRHLSFLSRLRSWVHFLTLSDSAVRTEPLHLICSGRSGASNVNRRARPRLMCAFCRHSMFGANGATWQQLGHQTWYFFFPPPSEWDLSEFRLCGWGSRPIWSLLGTSNAFYGQTKVR